MGHVKLALLPAGTRKLPDDGFGTFQKQMPLTGLQVDCERIQRHPRLHRNACVNDSAPTHHDRTTQSTHRHWPTSGGQAPQFPAAPAVVMIQPGSAHLLVTTSVRDVVDASTAAARWASTTARILNLQLCNVCD